MSSSGSPIHFCLPISSQHPINTLLQRCLLDKTEIQRQTAFKVDALSTVINYLTALDQFSGGPSKLSLIQLSTPSQLADKISKSLEIPRISCYLSNDHLIAYLEKNKK